jgi:hypothetical protein
MLHCRPRSLPGSPTLAGDLDVLQLGVRNIELVLTVWERVQCMQDAGFTVNPAFLETLECITFNLLASSKHIRKSFAEED